MTLSELGSRATAEVAAVLGQALPDQAEAMSAPILNARRIALYGVGREGLMIKALAMRLFHMGLDAHMVGDMTTPRIATGDLLIVSAGPGSFSTVAGLVEEARSAGAKVLCVTAEPGGAVPRSADYVVHLPAQTMANDRDVSGSVLPMGSLFEAVMFMFFEILILHLRAVTGMSADDMRANHTNME
ncbi:SIS domain-containing protein [Roseobacter sp. YSTF-M11]|uniref:SIS domain-containing protein n=1 Tax=Roseobacter insulae TaxID=2859783 RepID=A0A9X1FWV2_9RHOB|nr:6-phospho-3-hexuloisomerase [Roseobacter insulae]MBW4709128.1 SIS domain-containing protein [Roseobacter insulae]